MRGDAICALCTPKGKGALSLIRLSGPKALSIGRKLAGFLPERPESHKVYFGLLKRKGAVLDQVLISYFEEGRSFTGEETLEISCHGGEQNYNLILKALLEAGARPAEKGEFSFQAFSNGKIDLVQAEGVLQLIESQNESARKQAFSQLLGRLSEKLKELEKKWLFLLSHLEADIDFSLEGLDVFDKPKIQEHLEELGSELSYLLSRYRPFENLQKGLAVGIFGRTNSGKSSLFNALLEEDKAIVSKEEGATRDVVEGGLLNPGGLNISLKDCAGFRSSESEAEEKGQAKTRELFSRCDYKMLVLDADGFMNQELDQGLFSDPLKSFLVFTKKDLIKKEGKPRIKLSEHKRLKETKPDLQPKASNPQESSPEQEERPKDFVLKSPFKENTKLSSSAAEAADIAKLIKTLKKKIKDLKLPPPEQIFLVSALTKEGVANLRKRIISLGQINAEDFLISNYRHYKGLKLMEGALKNCENILKRSQGEKDLMALELRQGLLSLYEILGKQIDDRVLDKIFKEFCIGK